MTKAEYARSKQLERLTAAVAALRTDDGWQTYRRARKSFHSYSLNNIILIVSQRPDATLVKGFRQWNQLNRRVVRGAKAIWILAPSVRRAKSDDDEDRVFFRSVRVFDVTDTEQIPGEPEIPLTWESPELHFPGADEAFERLLNWLALQGTTVRSERLDGPRGYYSADKNLIVYDSLLTKPEALRVLIHEAIHAQGIGYRDYGREQAEAMTDMAAWLVCDTIGFDVTETSVPYVLGWNDAPEQVLTDQLAKITAAAATLEAVLLGSTADSEDRSQPASSEPQPAL